MTPRSGASGLPISTEIATAVSGGRVTRVTLTEQGGRRVAGALREDGSGWIPARPLRYGSQYTAVVTAQRADGQAETRSTTFRTTAQRPVARTGTGLYLFDGATYGVAMPVVVEFFPGIRPADRAGVQRRLLVTTTPPQPGVWHWVPNGTQAYYRAPKFWTPGTRLTARVALDGHPTGAGRHGDTDRSATVTIGRRLEMDVDNGTKQMSVRRDGRLVRKIPVSLGKKSTPSSSGTMVVMEKKEKTVFDTREELGPRDGYRIDITYAQRLTWGGEYIHAAPWSVADQGRRNVSHGCVNMSAEHAAWLFGQTMIGDPVTVRGTERRLTDGNGWTPWLFRWADYVRGSALPVPPELAAVADEDAAAG